MKVRCSIPFPMAMSTWCLVVAGLAACGSSTPAPAPAPAPSPPPGDGGARPPDGPPPTPPAPGPDAGVASAPLTTYQTCKDEVRMGDFELALRERQNDIEAFTGIEPATVYDSIDPSTIAKVEMEIGGCRILRPPQAIPPCSPECNQDTQICTLAGCKPRPTAQDLGTVSIDGLKVPGTLDKRAGDFVYTNPQWPHPAFDEGADLVLRATGAGRNAPFTARGWGVGSLIVPPEKLLVENGKPVTLTWTPPGKPGPTRMLINFSVNRHGSVDAWLECEVPDTGSHTIDAALVSRLFSFGLSGFPSVDMKRQTADTAMVASGCVEFNVVSAVNREITVPGLISCTGQDPEPGQPPPCPPGQTCGDDLRCQ
jgi:hypothetical protein